ncbi:MAG TPA: 3-deoxy-manno-octulosonate cytidylyltransferase [Blastocatellia bacterium]|nr:3-deoxy-manno-octulosonate cytidylyltransferase [Blastocatellia bacterium]
MEHHGTNHLQNVAAIIPARYASTRLPGKLLMPIAGRPLIAHTAERASAARNVSRVIVAADDQRIIDALRGYEVEVVMTSPQHLTGSDRIAEVAADMPHGTIIVNVQGDEPMISPKTIETAVDAYLGNEVDIVTTSERINSAKEALDPNVVKVVTDKSGRALYFSRSPIPYPRESVIRHGSLEKAIESEPELLSHFRKHTGLYVYSREFLLEFTKPQRGSLELIEMLEQLRVLECCKGSILVVPVKEESIGIDTAEDYDRVCRLMQQNQTSFATVND